MFFWLVPQSILSNFLGYFLHKHFIIYLKGKLQREKEGRAEKDLSSTVLIPQMPKQLGVDNAKGRSLEYHPDFPCEWQGYKTWAIFWYFPTRINKELNWNWSSLNSDLFSDLGCLWLDLLCHNLGPVRANVISC